MYRRHTNFAIESIEQTFNGTVDFGRKVSCTVSRNGDLIHKVYLQVDLPALSNTNGTTGSLQWVNNIGHVMIDEVSIEIGGQTIDKHYGDWLNIWNELTQTAEKEGGYDDMIGATTDAADTVPARTLYVPLQFWLKAHWPKKQTASNEKDSLMKNQLVLLANESATHCFYPLASTFASKNNHSCNTIKLRGNPKAEKN